jgi:hypothetical protein
LYSPKSDHKPSSSGTSVIFDTSSEWPLDWLGKQLVPPFIDGAQRFKTTGADHPNADDGGDKEYLQGFTLVQLQLIVLLFRKVSA